MSYVPDCFINVKNNILQFPPQGLDAGDSFFAFQDNNKQGRVYIGAATNTGKTHPVVQKIVHASLLQSFKSCNSERNVNKDPYYTLINYYNSIRELGSGATQISADIPEYLNAMWLRKGIKKSYFKKLFRHKLFTKLVYQKKRN